LLFVTPAIAVTAIVFGAPAAAAVLLPLLSLPPLLPPLSLSSLLPLLLPLPPPSLTAFAAPVVGWLLRCTQKIDMCHHCSIIVATARIVLFLLIIIIAVSTTLGVIACPSPPSSCCVVRIALRHSPQVARHPLVSHRPPPPPLVLLSVTTLASCCPSSPFLVLSNTRLPPKLSISI
jgi:hypothetical protein